MSATDPRFELRAGFDRDLALDRGDSVRYLVVDVAATSGETAARETLPVNLALSIDVSGSMNGAKIEAARSTARDIVSSLAARDHLSIVTFNEDAHVLLPSMPMDGVGRSAALEAVNRLFAGGMTNLFEGWWTSAEAVAQAMAQDGCGAGRVLVLSDGLTNRGVVDTGEITRHVGALFERGVISSAVGIGDDYDQILLGALSEAGGGGLHDAATADEIGEVVLGELREGRATLIERVKLRLNLPAGFKPEVLGAWAVRPDADALEIQAGGLLPGQTRRVVIRVKCPSGFVGASVPFSITAIGTATTSNEEVRAATQATMRFAGERENGMQDLNADRAAVVVRAWANHLIREATVLAKSGGPREAETYLGRQLPWFTRYAERVDGGEALIQDLQLLWRRIARGLDRRTSRAFYVGSHKGSRHERDLRFNTGPSFRERLGE